MKNRAIATPLSIAVSVVLALSWLSGVDAADIASTLRDLDLTVLSGEERRGAAEMISRDIERRRRSAIQRENIAWSEVNSREEWQRFRDQRLEAIRRSLGRFPNPPEEMKVDVTGQLEGDGYRIENIVFESRPGLFVTANLYTPSQPKYSMPAILLSHSHHAPKTQGELQDMGMTWAREGWVVLVIDHVGHGERRQHPFVSRDDYAEPFRVSRQDYYFRYNVGLQLQLVGESLIGWMVWDLMRGVDLLCARDDVDKERIILIGSVAGGGDPAGVAAALDPRIAAVAPLNFGGPQPDYAIPDDAENEFYYFGVAYWETTRCLRLGGRDGFAHWTIVASVAPRRLIYAHEFSWQQLRDPVWPRLVKVFDFYDARDHLGVATGRGNLKGRPPESTHCSNVGVFHRRKLYPNLRRWFDMEPPREELRQRRSPDELRCLTPNVRKKINPQPVSKLASKLGVERVAEARRRIQGLNAEDRRHRLRNDWSQLLGDIEPTQDPKVMRVTTETLDDVIIERGLLEVEPNILVPLVRLRATSKEPGDSPTVLIVTRAGKQRTLKARFREIAELVKDGAVVCLPDLRGTGESDPGSAVGPRSVGTSLSCRDQVLGQTLLGSRLRDLRSVLKFVRKQGAGPIVLWGDSLATVNPKDRSEVVPHGVDNPNFQAEAGGGLLALLGSLFEDDVRAVYASGTFASFQSLLESQFLYVPHDVVVPGALTTSDVSSLAAALAPRPLRMDRFVDGLNRRVSAKDLSTTLAATIESYRAAEAHDKLLISGEVRGNVASWLLRSLRDPNRETESAR